MGWKLNPFTGTIEQVGAGGTSTGPTIAETIGAILLSVDESTDPDTVEILFDEDSILYNYDDGV